MVSGFLGRGWGFPISFHHRAGVGMVTEEEDIAQSLHILLGTRPGERVMHPDYGCGLHALAFERIDGTSVRRIRERVEHAVLFYEPRIDLDGVEIDTSDAFNGVLLIELAYRIRSTNNRSNIVYPFYLAEGTHVRL